MPVEVKLPPLGENVKSADVVSLLVKVGDVIRKDQDVLEAETDKAVMPVPSNAAGKITAIHVKKGDKVTPGQLIITLDESAAAAPSVKPAAPATAKPGAPSTPASAPVSSSREAAHPAPAPSAPTPPATPVPQSPPPSRVHPSSSSSIHRVLILAKPTALQQCHRASSPAFPPLPLTYPSPIMWLILVLSA